MLTRQVKERMSQSLAEQSKLADHRRRVPSFNTEPILLEKGIPDAASCDLSAASKEAQKTLKKT
jgi:hypothetical protein